MKAFNIMWDIDSPEDLNNLPAEIYLPPGMTDEDEISDYITSKTGFCHFGFDTDIARLENLVGFHTLTGYAYGYGPPNDDAWTMEDVNMFYFTLDDVTYVAKEDPQDGYRSCMEYLEVVHTLPPGYISIPPVLVECKMGTGSQEELLIVTDILSQLTVCMVGTDDYDDYYPCFIGYINLENIWHNRPENTTNKLEVSWDDIELFQ